MSIEHGAQHMRVLVVDDNPANVEYFIGALETAGHVVEVEVDGIAGRDRALREAFDLIILDIQLPSMSGEAVCRELRAAGLTSPIVALTSAAMPEQISRGTKAGFDAYLTKPISPNQLRETARRFARPSV
ncbi:MAG: response regulator [Chloroflexi bacterium]|nr:MAG: response regulator [Chloroflexota bacterium]